jgi:dipeptidyl aminopeptidase/acylaminoacyl peptidase
MRIVPRIWLIATLIVVPFTVVAQQPPVAPRPIAIDDRFQIREVAGPQLSPDAQWVAYMVNTMSLKEDKTEQRIWMVPFAGGEAIPLTAEGVSSSHPRWSPDGKYLAFLSARHEGKTQVWLLNRTGGEAQQLTNTPQAVDSFVWSPDGKRLCLVLRDPTSEELEAAKEKERQREGDDEKSKDGKDKKHKAQRPWVIDRLQFKVDEVGYLEIIAARTCTPSNWPRRI